MNKGELIDVVAKDAGISRAMAGKVLNSIIDTVTKALKEGDKVSLVGFGTFSIVNRKARKGRNPQTGEEIEIPAKKVVKFKVGANLAKTDG